MSDYLVHRYTYCGKSATHGLGVFAKEDMEPGTVWWALGPNNTLEISKDVYHRVQAVSKHHTAWGLFIDAIDTYAFYDPNKDVLIYCLCNARYTNHSDSPNASVTGENNHNLSRLNFTVPKDTEIFENYLHYGSSSWAKDCSAFLPTDQNGSNGSVHASPYIKSGPMYIVLSKEQLDLYIQSHMETPLHKALLSCLIHFGSFDNGVWRISIPDCSDV